MKFKYYLLLLGLLLGRSGYSQSGAPVAVSDSGIRKNTEALVSKYSLNADQAKQMYHIQLRKNTQIAGLAELREGDIALYQAKYQNIQQGTWNAIRRILNTKDQVDIFRKTQNEIQALRKAKRRELATQKTSKEAIEAAVMAIYAE